MKLLDLLASLIIDWQRTVPNLLGKVRFIVMYGIYETNGKSQRETATR